MLPNSMMQKMNPKTNSTEEILAGAQDNGTRRFYRGSISKIIFTQMLIAMMVETVHL